MKKAIVPIVILLLIACNSFAQVDYQISSALDLYRANKAATGEFKQYIAEEDIDGSPYLDDEFVIGTWTFFLRLQVRINLALRIIITDSVLESTSCIT